MRINNESARALGVTPDKALGSNFYDLLSPQNAAEVRQKDKALLANRGVSDKGLRKMTLKNGEVYWLEYEEIVYDNPNTSEPTIYTVAADVTKAVVEHQKAVQLLTQIQLLTDMTHIGYWSVNIATSEVFWSTEVFRIHGVTPDTYSPALDTALDFYHPDDKQDVESELQASIDKNREFHLERRIVRPDGTVVPVETHGVAVFDEAGEISHIIGVFREI